MHDNRKTEFVDFLGRAWRIRLRAPFWIWFERCDRAQHNLSSALYVALRSEFNAAGVTPEQSALITASPDAVRAFAAALEEWIDG